MQTNENKSGSFFYAFFSFGTMHNGFINFEKFTACLWKFVKMHVSAFVEEKGDGISKFEKLNTVAVLELSFPASKSWPFLVWKGQGSVDLLKKFLD